MKLEDLVPIPPKDSVNNGLSSATEATMSKVLGAPGELTKKCSPPTGDFLKRVKTNIDVGPFKVTGLDFAVESLIQLFAEVKVNAPDVFGAVKTAGALCVRCRRNNPSRYSNHSWGAARGNQFFNKNVDFGLILFGSIGEETTGRG